MLIVLWLVGSFTVGLLLVHVIWFVACGDGSFIACFVLLLWCWIVIAGVYAFVGICCGNVFVA